MRGPSKTLSKALADGAPLSGHPISGDRRGIPVDQSRTDGVQLVRGPTPMARWWSTSPYCRCRCPVPVSRNRGLNSKRSLLSEGRRQELFRPKDAIAPVAPIVATTMSDGRGWEGATEHVRKRRCTADFHNRNTKHQSTKRGTKQSIAPLNDQIVRVL